MTIEAMGEAFKAGGKAAISKVMRQSPAMFLKMLVLLVPREMQIEHNQGVKGMSDEALAQAIEALEAFIARRSGDLAKVVEAKAAEDVSAS